MGLVWVMLLVFGTAFVVALLYFARPQAGLQISESKDGFTVFTDASGLPVAVEVQPGSAQDAANGFFAVTLKPVYFFVYGLLVGVGGAVAAANALIAGASTHRTVFFGTGWVMIVLAAWIGVYLCERHRLARLRRSGDLDAVFARGIDPMAFASSVCVTMRIARSRLNVLMFALGAVITLPPADPPLISGFLALMALGLIVRQRSGCLRRVNLREVDMQVRPVRDFLLAGGWVAPLGVLLAVASALLVPLYAGRPSVTFLILLMNVGILLTVWGERQSRSTHATIDASAWRTLLLRRLSGDHIEASEALARPS